MNQRLTEKLSKLPEALAGAKNVQDLTVAVVEVERLALKSNYDDRQAGGTVEEYEKREYLVGEANTRGLSWKLNLLRTVAGANFSRMVRLGVHGGSVAVLGQPTNLDATFQVYDALVPTYERLSGSAFTEFSDGSKTDGEAPAVNKTGWINNWLVSAPAELEAALAESRAKDAASNSKIAKMVEEAESALKTFQATALPATTARAPKAPKAPKEPKAPKVPKSPKGKKSTGTPEGNAPTDESISASEVSDLTPDDGSDAYPGDSDEEAEGDATDTEVVG